jgi:hypothetical protein
MQSATTAQYAHLANDPSKKASEQFGSDGPRAPNPRVTNIFNGDADKEFGTARALPEKLARTSLPCDPHAEALWKRK